MEQRCLKFGVLDTMSAVALCAVVSTYFLLEPTFLRMIYLAYAAPVLGIAYLVAIGFRRSNRSSLPPDWFPGLLLAYVGCSALLTLSIAIDRITGASVFGVLAFLSAYLELLTFDALIFRSLFRWSRLRGQRNRDGCS